MITWGLISIATAFATGPISFSIARFLLGLAEAGFTPGVYLYFTYWFPGKWRAKATAAFLLGIPVANIVGSPLSGWLLEQHGIWGLKNWQLLLVTEAMPAVLLGVACLFVLVDTPAKAKWLTAREKTWLNDRIAKEQQTIGASHGTTLRAALTNPKVFTLAAINFCCIVGSIGIGIWLPQIIKGLGISNGMIGLVVALPYLLGAVSMTLWARLANRSQRRLPYVVSALALAAVALVEDRQSQRSRGQHPVVPGNVLGHSLDVPHRPRGGGRTGDDRFDRQPGRLHRGCDQQLYPALLRRGVDPADRHLPDDLAGRPGQTTARTAPGTQ